MSVPWSLEWWIHRAILLPNVTRSIGFALWRPLSWNDEQLRVAWIRQFGLASYICGLCYTTLVATELLHTRFPGCVTSRGGDKIVRSFSGVLLKIKFTRQPFTNTKRTDSRNWTRHPRNRKPTIDENVIENMQKRELICLCNQDTHLEDLIFHKPSLMSRTHWIRRNQLVSIYVFLFNSNRTPLYGPLFNSTLSLR